MGILQKNILKAISQKTLVTLYCEFGIYTGFITDVDKPSEDDPYIEILYMDYVQNDDSGRINKDVENGLYDFEELDIDDDLKKQLENPDKFFTKRVFSLSELHFIDFNVEHSLAISESLFVKNFREVLIFADKKVETDKKADKVRKLTEKSVNRHNVLKAVDEKHSGEK